MLAASARSGLIKFRRAHPLLGRAEFLAPQDITWHEDHWDNPESKFLAFSLHDRRAPWPPWYLCLCPPGGFCQRVLLAAECHG